MPRLPKATSPAARPADDGSLCVTAAGTTNLPEDARALQKNCAPRFLDGSLGFITTELPKTVTMEFARAVPPVPPVQAMVKSVRGGELRLPTLVQTRLSGMGVWARNAHTSGPPPDIRENGPGPNVPKKTFRYPPLEFFTIKPEPGAMVIPSPALSSLPPRSVKSGTLNPDGGS